jgi:hypothetical protein
LSSPELLATADVVRSAPPGGKRLSRVGSGVVNLRPHDVRLGTWWRDAHGFTNTGEGELRLTAIHGAGRCATEWLDGADPVWTLKHQA